MEQTEKQMDLTIQKIEEIYQSKNKEGKPLYKVESIKKLNYDHVEEFITYDIQLDIYSGKKEINHKFQDKFDKQESYWLFMAKKWFNTSTNVLKGSDVTLKNPSLMALIVELNGSGRRYGFSDNDIHQKLLNYGFNPFKYDPFSRSLFSVEESHNQNIIYIRDVDFALQRVRAAKKIKISNFFDI